MRLAGEADDIRHYQPGPQGFAMVDVAGTRIELIDTVMLPMFETWYRTGSFG